jgi:opine dehydrogenase
MAIEKNSVLAVIGAGFGGKGIAASLGLDGFRIRIHDIDAARLAPIQAIKGLRITKHAKNFVPIDVASTRMAEVVDGAALVLVSTYGNEHEAVARELAPLLRDGQTVLLVQGHFFGSWLFRRTLDAAGCKAKVDIAEMDSYPYMVGITAPDTVEMGTVKAKWRLASTPTSRTQAVLAQVGSMFPGMIAANSVMDAAFSLGGVFHICGILTNVGRVESPGPYNFYAANMTPSVCNFIEAMDRERIAIARAYSVHMEDVRTWLASTYGLKHESLRDSLQEMAVTHYEHAPAPKSLAHRYLVQDVGCDLVGAVSLARAAGVATPVSDAAITLASTLTKRDFLAEGRNLERLGLAGKGPQQILESIRA